MTVGLYSFQGLRPGSRQVSTGIRHAYLLLEERTNVTDTARIQQHSRQFGAQSSVAKP